MSLRSFQKEATTRHAQEIAIQEFDEFNGRICNLGTGKTPYPLDPLSERDLSALEVVTSVDLVM